VLNDQAVVDPAVQHHLLDAIAAPAQGVAYAYRNKLTG
jgi:hypothetical protein